MYLAANIGDSAQRGADTFFEWLPRLIGAIVILVITWAVAKAVANLLARILPRTGMDRAVHSGTHGALVARHTPGFQPSNAIARIAYWTVLLMGVLLALSTLGIAALDNFIAAVLGYLPNVVAAILILVVAIALAGAVAGASGRLMGGTGLGAIVATVVPVLILTVAVFMTLVQLRIAVPIVTGAFYIVLGAIGLGAALAFGLGGRGAAQRMLDTAYERGREAAPDARMAYRTAKQRVNEGVDGVRTGATPDRRGAARGGIDRSFEGDWSAGA